MVGFIWPERVTDYVELIPMAAHFFLEIYLYPLYRKGNGIIDGGGQSVTRVKRPARGERGGERGERSRARALGDGVL